MRLGKAIVRAITAETEASCRLETKVPGANRSLVRELTSPGQCHTTHIAKMLDIPSIR